MRSGGIRHFSTFVLFLALSRPLAAEEASSAKEDPAALFELGLSAMLEGRFGVGCAFIRRSQDLDPRAGTLFTLAECYRQAGKVASAVELYDQYLALFAELPPDEQERQKARAAVSQQERTRLMNKVPWLTVVLPDWAPSGVVITMDGNAFSHNLLGVPLAVDPGKHEFTTRAPGGWLIGQVVEIEPQERRTLTLNLRPSASGAVESPAPPSPDRPPPEQHGRSPWLYVAGAVGAAGLATGAVAGVILLDKRSTIKRACQPAADGPPQCSQEGLDAVRSAQNVFGPMANIALGVGLAGTIAASIIWFSEDSPVNQPSVRLGTRIAARPGGGELHLQGTF